MTDFFPPESSVAIARRIVMSWAEGSNTVLVAPPLTDPTSVFDMLSDRKFHSECGFGKNLPAVARFRVGRIESPGSFIKGVVAQWDPDGEVVCTGTDIGGDLRKVLRAVFDSGRIPVLIIEAFHQAVRTLTWDVGTALRDLEHTMKLRTVVELPVKLSTLRTRWAVEKNPNGFLASEFGQGHSTLMLKGYSPTEIRSAALSRGLNEAQSESIIRLSGGIPDLTNWLIRESQYCETLEELSDVAESGASDICYRFFKWLDAPGETSFTKTLAKMHQKSSMDGVFATIDFHDWGPFLLTPDKNLGSHVIGFAATYQLLARAALQVRVPFDECDTPEVATQADCGLETILVVATCWGVRYGGINSFNLDFCASLVSKGAKKYKVICIVPTDSDIIEETGDVEVVYLRTDGGNAFFSFDRRLALDVLKIFGPIHYVIGHDLITGNFCCDLANDLNAKSVVFCHMSYAAYYSMMNSSIESSSKVESQRRLLTRADAIFAVGPKLAKHAQSLLRVSTSRAPVFEYLPSLLGMTPARSPRDIPCITYVGRLGQGSELVKQGLLAVMAIGVAIKELKLRDPLVRFIGSADAEDESLYKKIINDSAGKLVSTEFLAFRESRLETLNFIIDSSLVVMPSVHDGFGLVGWEAISLGIPLVISENTGLYEHLTEIGLQGYVGSVEILGSMDEPREEDVRSLAAQLVLKLKDPRKSHDDAAALLSKIADMKLDSFDNFSAAMLSAFKLSLSQVQL